MNYLYLSITYDFIFYQKVAMNIYYVKLCKLHKRPATLVCAYFQACFKIVQIFVK